MTEPNEVEFHEPVVPEARRRSAQSLPVRAGIAAGAAALVLVGAVAAMGASPASNGAATAELSANVDSATGTSDAAPLADGRRFPGHGGFRNITITAINGSSLSLKTDDGWTRTITVASSTTISKAGETIALSDLAVGDQIGFAQERASDGTYSVTAIKVVLPHLGGEVTAISGNTITVTGKDGTTGTIHVDADTTYRDGDGTAALSDIAVGDFVIGEGALRADGSLDADVVHTGRPGFRDGFRGGRGFPGGPDKLDPSATPTPTPGSTAS
jgi:uncharacterized protein DUF5666